MALSGSHEPKLSMTSSFGSMLSLADRTESDIGVDGGQLMHPLRRSPPRPKRAAAARSPAVGAGKGMIETSPLLGKKRNGDQNVGGDAPPPPPLLSRSPPESLNATLLVTIFAITIGSSLQFGYGTGVMNNSEAFILDYFHNRGKEYTLMEWGTTVSCYGAGGLVGSFVGPKVIGNYVGRKATLLINNAFLLLSSYLIAFAPEWWYQAVGRVFVGIVAGIATAVAPTYLAEISPVEVRGAISTMHQLAITVGILISQFLSTPSLNLLGSEEKWQWLFLVPVLCGLVQVIVLPFCPESPSYLYMTKGEAASRNALVRLQSEAVADVYLGYIEEEVSAVQQQKQQQQQQQQQQKLQDNNAGEDAGSEASGMTILELFLDRSLRKQLVVGVTVQLMMQFSGIDAVFYYSTSVFYQANVSDPEFATTCLGIVNVLVTVVAVRFMDTAGRKTLLTYSWIGMCASYVTLTFSFILKPYVGFMDQVRIAFL